MPHLGELVNLTEQLASTSVLVDASDLTSLAELHTRLQAVGRWAETAPAPARAAHAGLLEKLSSAAGGAEKLVERVVLAEVADADAALRQVNETIKQLQSLVHEAGSQIDAAAGEAPASEAPPAAGVVGPGDHSPDELARDAEAPINPDDVGLITEFISESTTHLEGAERELLRLDDDPHNPDIVAAAFRSFHTIKGVAGFLNLKQIGLLAHTAESLLDLARHGRIELSGENCDLVLGAVDAMRSLLKSLASAVRDRTPIPVMADLAPLMDRLHACGAGAAVTVANRAASTAVPESPAIPARTGGAPQEASVKVATDRLDALIDMIGELVIAQSMVSQATAILTADNQRLARNMGHLGKITRELQSLSMSLRMVPVGGLFQRMARLVRDTARKTDKDVEFVSTGGETELDRNVVEAIADPLVHMLRNAVDHGIETPAERTSVGKSRVGRIELRASHQGGNVVIEITDDGKGLNRPRLIRKAIEAGIVREDQPLGEQEAFRLVFHPGLSTAEKVTDVSGRGVGMDVVKKNVEALRGKIDIRSTEGRGSAFTIRLPLTLAVIDGLVVRVGSERYILPLAGVERSIRPTTAQLSTVHARGELLMVRGHLVPMFRLHRLFDVQPSCEDPTAAVVVIVQDEDRRCGLLVDELVGRQQVVIKSLGAAIGTVQGVSSGAVLGDGNISLILDVPGLIALANR